MATAGDVSNQGGVAVSASLDISQKLANTATFGGIGGPNVSAGQAPVPAGFFNDNSGSTGVAKYVVVGVILVVAAVIFMRK